MVQLKWLLAFIVKTAMKEYMSLKFIYKWSMHKGTQIIVADPSHVFQSELLLWDLNIQTQQLKELVCINFKILNSQV